MLDMDDERLDAAIDETARRMTMGEPQADFGERVLAQIESGFGARSAFAVRRSPFMMYPALASLGALAAIVAALVVLRGPARDDRRPADSSARDRQSVALRTDATRTSEAAPSKVDATSRSRAVRAEPETAGESNPALNVEPLTTASIDVESIAVAALAALATDQSIHIEPLPPLQPIAVTPLGVENQGEPR